jgi:hypothetical protein
LLSVIAVIAAVALSPGGVDPQGKPLGTDFISFYAASALARHDPAAAYLPALHGAAQAAALPTMRYGYTTFLYPPPFLLLCLALSTLPYLAALGAWLAASLAALALPVSRLLPKSLGILPFFAFPGLLVNAGHGQNGCITGALFAGYMVIGERFPFLGGALLGALVIKPQLALAVPFALLAARRWRAIAGATAAWLGLCLLLLLALGPQAWRGFLAGGDAARTMLEQGQNGFPKLQSTFAALRLAGAGIDTAWAGQATVAIAIIGALIWTARRRPGVPAEGAALAIAGLLVSPWSFDYDLALLARPLAWVAAAARTGFRPWEKIVLLTAYCLPLFSRAVADNTAIALGPLVLLALFWVVQRRAAA